MMKRWLVVLVLAAAVGGSAQAQAQQPPPTVTAVPAPPDVKEPPADAAKSGSGLVSKVLQPGTGDKHPGPLDLVTVHYTGWTTDGKMFDNSHARKAPSTFSVDRVVKGFGEGVQLMVVGEKRRLWIPQELGYRGAAGRPQGMLVFDIELIEIAPSPSVPPPDVGKPPADTKKTPSGLAYKTLKSGSGTVHPKRESRVTVHYTGWTTEGKMFDSSVMRGAPATFALNEVIDGWTEGVQLMVEGEKARFWIPAKLAYQGRQGPQGMLVFDIELIAIR